MWLTDELKKTVIFFCIDIVCVFLFTWAWFKFYEKQQQPQQQIVSKSLKFTIAMQLWFFTYYFAFDALWTHTHSDVR